MKAGNTMIAAFRRDGIPMTLNRRTLLVAAASLAMRPGIAQEAPDAITIYEHETGGRVGLYVENLATGRKIAWRADERFVMCSTFKASLAACVLSRVDRGEEHLEAMVPFTDKDMQSYAPVAKQHFAKREMSIEQMCEGAVELSDNTCANLLLARVGGPSALTAFWRSSGDTVTRLNHNEPELNRSPPGNPNDTTTPLAMAGNLRRFLLGEVLSPDSRQRLTGWMVNCKTGDNRLRVGLPKDWKVADKTGSSGKDAAGDIAVVWPRPGRTVLIAAYVQGGSPSGPQFTALFGEIGRMVGERLA
jgi:beta-lactamase class A